MRTGFFFFLLVERLPEETFLPVEDFLVAEDFFDPVAVAAASAVPAPGPMIESSPGTSREAAARARELSCSEPELRSNRR